MLPVCGANLIGFDTSEYVGPDARVAQSLDSFAALGGNWVAVNFWWFQDGPTSVEITPDPGFYTISDEAIAAAVHAAHDRGLKVMLRPMIDLRDGLWRRFIRPSPEWFEQYLRFISSYASRAAEWEVEAYSVGAELALTEHWESDWRRVIEAVRAA